MNVSLKEIFNCLSELMDFTSAFLDKRSGEVVVISEDEAQAAEDGENLDEYPDWERAIIRRAKEIEDTDHYLALPTRFDINEHEIMREFCDSMPSDPLRDELLQGISGTGAFRRFREICHQRDLTAAWHRFRDHALATLARSWLEENGIAFLDDLPTEPPPDPNDGAYDGSELLSPVAWCVAIIKPTQLYIDWAQSLPRPIEDLTLAELREDCTALLLPLVTDLQDADIYIRRLWPTLFEQELEGWVTNEALWPDGRDYDMFCRWFDIEVHSEVFHAIGLDDAGA